MRPGRTHVERLDPAARRLRPVAVIDTLARTVAIEMDLRLEAAALSEMAETTSSDQGFRVPKVEWELTARDVLTLEWIDGIKLSDVAALEAAGHDLPGLARRLIQSFLRHALRDGFFHADMHPGNIYVGDSGIDFNRYIAIDFGIVGTLTDYDKNYLAQNFLAFFHRDYKRVAVLHIESGWVPKGTRVDELESAIRATCEPVFDLPLARISLGQVLLRLFQTSRRFNVEIQPQLVLLQKTLLNVEGLGRQLDPELDLWSTAQPFLERWMNQQVGWRGFIDRLKDEAPRYAHYAPALPRLVHQALSLASRKIDPAEAPASAALVTALLKEQRRTNRLLQAMLYVAVGFVVGLSVVRFVYFH